MPFPGPLEFSSCASWNSLLQSWSVRHRPRSSTMSFLCPFEFSSVPRVLLWSVLFGSSIGPSGTRECRSLVLLNSPSVPRVLLVVTRVRLRHRDPWCRIESLWSSRMLFPGPVEFSSCASCLLWSVVVGSGIGVPVPHPWGSHSGHPAWPILCFSHFPPAVLVSSLWSVLVGSGIGDPGAESIPWSSRMPFPGMLLSILCASCPPCGQSWSV